MVGPSVPEETLGEADRTVTDAWNGLQIRSQDRDRISLPVIVIAVLLLKYSLICRATSLALLLPR